MIRLALTPELRPARRHAPGPLAALESAHAAACAAIDPVLADSLRRRVAANLGLATGTEALSLATERERACADFADQFVAYVPGIGEELRAAAVERLEPEQLLDLARMLYVFDMTDRLVMSLARLFPPRPGDERSDAATEPFESQTLGESVTGLHAAAMRLRELDPVTTELVRLHCANYHDCKT